MRERAAENDQEEGLGVTKIVKYNMPTKDGERTTEEE